MKPTRTMPICLVRETGERMLESQMIVVSDDKPPPAEDAKGPIVVT